MTSGRRARRRTVEAESDLLQAFFRCRSYLTHVVGRIVQPHNVEDIVQETFLRCYEASARGKIRHPQAFMVKTATNLALNVASTADSRLTDRVANFVESTVPLVTEPLEDSIEAQERLLLFCRAARRLPLQCRRAYLLKKVYGLSRKEIAAYMEISESTVQKHIAKGTLMCAEYMEALERPGRNETRSRVNPEEGTSQV